MCVWPYSICCLRLQASSLVQLISVTDKNGNGAILYGAITRDVKDALEVLQA